MPKRDYSIDILKFIAAILITNSHMDLLYVKYSFLSTGGSIGDALFFFCSGYTLFLKPLHSIVEFPNWYKKRINRIYPSILATAIIACICFNSNKNIVDIILYGGGWFITCIMVFYVFIFLIGTYGIKRIPLIGAILIVSTAICFIFLNNHPSLYSSHNSIRWLVYFIFMLFGAYLGSIHDKITSRGWIDLALLIACIIAYYACFFGGLRLDLRFLQTISILPMIGILFYAYKTFKSNFVLQAYNNQKFIKIPINLIGGLCLEIYLVQFYLFTDKMNCIFPLNIVIMFIIIFAVAYITRCLARLISQTFNDAPYNVKAIFTI